MLTVAVLLALVLGPVLSGCGGAGGPRALPSGPTPTGAAGTPAATPAPSTVAADAVATAYLRFWDAVIAAHRAADPRSPGLAAVAGEPQLTRVRQAGARNPVHRAG